MIFTTFPNTITLFFLLASSGTSSAKKNLSLRRANGNEPAENNHGENRRSLLETTPTAIVGCQNPFKSGWGGVGGSSHPDFNVPAQLERGCADNEIAVGLRFRRQTGEGGARWSSLKLLCDDITSLDVKNYVNPVTGGVVLEPEITLAGAPTPADTGSYGKSNSNEDFVDLACPEGHVLMGVIHKFRRENGSPFESQRFVGLQARCRPLPGVDASSTITDTDMRIVPGDNGQAQLNTFSCGSYGWVTALDGTTVDINVGGGDTEAALIGIRFKCCGN